MEKQPNLRVTSKDIAPYVLMPGDPGRVELIAKYLEGGQLVSDYREFKVYTGRYKGVPVSVVSTGIGCPSTAIAVEEAINLGAKVFIRVGTCGGAWRKDIPLGSLVIPTACVRDEGTTKEYIPSEFPAVADLDVTNALRVAAKKQGVRFFLGINRTHDAFYGADFSIKKWGAYMQDKRLQPYPSPIISSEMETAALLVIAALRGVKAGAVLAVNANPEPLIKRLQGKYLPVVSEVSPATTRSVVNRMIKVALRSIIILNARDTKL